MEKKRSGRAEPDSPVSTAVSADDFSEGRRSFCIDLSPLGSVEDGETSLGETPVTVQRQYACLYGVSGISTPPAGACFVGSSPAVCSERRRGIRLFISLDNDEEELEEQQVREGLFFMLLLEEESLFISKEKRI